MTPSYFYNAYGLGIKSEIPLPELPSIKPINKPDVKIVLGKVCLPSNEVFRGTSKHVQGLLQTIFDDMGLCCSENGYKCDEHALYRFLDGIGNFMLCNGEKIVIDPAKNVDFRLLCRYLLGGIFALFLTQRNYFVLHASSVNIGGFVVAFSGLSRVGKSTTAFEFYNKGYPVVADDYIAINFENDCPVVTPAFPTLKLSREYIKYNKINPKNIIDWDSDFNNLYVRLPNEFSERQLPLKNIFLLERGDSLSIEKMEIQEVFNELLSCTFGASIFTTEEKKRNLLNYSRLIKHVTFRKLIIPSSFNSLPSVVKKIENDFLTH